MRVRLGADGKRPLETGRVECQTLDQGARDREQARRIARRRRRDRGGAALELGDLRCEPAAARLELEQQRLGRLAGEPELAARGIPADSLLGDGGGLRREQLLERDDRQLELLRVAADDDDQRAEPRRTRALDERERRRRIVGEQGAAAMAERRGNRALFPGGHVEHAQDEPLALLGECTCCRRQAFALGECVLERREALARELDELVVVSPRPRGRRSRPRLELLGQALGGFAAKREPFTGGAQPVERGGRALALAGGVGELLLGGCARGEQRLQVLLELLPRRQCRAAPALRLGAALAERREIERGDRRLQPVDFLGELLGALGGRRLQRERPHALAHLGLDVAARARPGSPTRASFSSAR